MAVLTAVMATTLLQLGHESRFKTKVKFLSSTDQASGDSIPRSNLIPYLLPAYILNRFLLFSDRSKVVQLRNFYLQQTTLNVSSSSPTWKLKMRHRLL